MDLEHKNAWITWEEQRILRYAITSANFIPSSLLTGRPLSSSRRSVLLPTIMIAVPSSVPSWKYQTSTLFNSIQFNSISLLKEGDVITCYSFLTYGPLRALTLPTMIYHRRQTTAPGTTCPTLYDKCAGSFTSHRIVNIEGLWDGTSGLSSLSEKTRESNHLQMWLQRQHLLSYLKTLSVGPAGVELTTSRVTARCSTNWATLIFFVGKMSLPLNILERFSFVCRK